jgi:hypothetical protein
MVEGQSVSLPWCQTTIWDLWPFFLSPWILLDSWSLFWVSSLTRGLICNLLAQIRVTLGSKSGTSRDHHLLSHLILLRAEGPGPCLYISQAQGGPVIPRGTGFPFRCLLRFAGLRLRYSSPPPPGYTSSDSTTSGCEMSLVPSRQGLHIRHFPRLRHLRLTAERLLLPAVSILRECLLRRLISHDCFLHSRYLEMAAEELLISWWTLSSGCAC